jgi:hypothetical protein
MNSDLATLTAMGSESAAKFAEMSLAGDILTAAILFTVLAAYGLLALHLGGAK